MKMSSHALKKENKENEKLDVKHLYYVFRFMCKVDHNSDKFIHVPTYIYNEIMRLLKLVGVIKFE